jgi:hypothetical protein
LDFTCVFVWKGWLYVVFDVGMYARRIMGWWIRCNM